METTWKVPDPVRLLWRAWEDEVVVFNCASDDTHVLNVFAAETLGMLEDGPATTAQLAERVAAKLDLDVDEDLWGRMKEVLVQLADLDLVERR